jgi:hypothetical protein
MSKSLLTERINTYFAILVIVIFGAFCALTIIRVGRESYTELGIALWSQNETAL